MPKDNGKPFCDVDDCSNDAVQVFVTEGGLGPIVSRCELHSIPVYDVASTWQQTLPKPKK